VAGTGLGALTLTTQPTTAEVTANIDIPDAGYRDKQPLYTPWLTVDGSWSYSNLDVDPDEYRLTLLVSQSANNADRVAQKGAVPFGFDAGKDYVIQAPLIDAAAFAESDFKASDGQTITVDVYATVRFEVFASGEIVAKAAASDSGVLTIEDTSATFDASLTGSGGWEWQANQSDATPTPP